MLQMCHCYKHIVNYADTNTILYIDLVPVIAN